MSLLKKALANLASKADAPVVASQAARVTELLPAAPKKAPRILSPEKEPPRIDFPAPLPQEVLEAAPLIVTAGAGAPAPAAGCVAHDAALVVDRKIDDLYQMVSAELAHDVTPIKSAALRTAPPVHVSVVPSEEDPRPSVRADPPPQREPAAAQPHTLAPVVFPHYTAEDLAAYHQIRERLQSEKAAAGWHVLGLAATRAAAQIFASGMLAQAFVDGGRGAILLVDAQRRPHSTWPHPGAPPGLFDVLQGRCRWPQVVLQTSQPNLQLITAGGSELTQDRLPRGLWDALRDRYSAILVDAGQADAAVALPLLAACDATVLVVHLARDERSSVSELARNLRQAGVELLGTIAVGSPG